MPLSILVAWLAATAFIGFLFGVFYYSQIRAERHLREQIVSVAQMAADRIALTIDYADSLLVSVDNELLPGDYDTSKPLSQGQLFRLQTLLAQRQSQRGNIFSLMMLDAQGRVLASSVSVAGGVPPLADGDGQMLRTAGVGLASMRIIAPVSDSGEGWRARLVRQLLDAAGKPAGLLIAQIELDTCLAKFAQLPIFERNDAMTLSDTVKGVLTRYPVQGAPFSALGDFAIRGAAAAEAAGGVYYARAASNDHQHLVAYRAVAHHPLYVAYGKNIEKIRTIWRYLGMAVLVATLLALATTVIVTTGIRRRMVLAGQLEEMRHHLQESNNALRVALAASELVAARDQLTGLWNRRSFDQRLEETIAHLARHDGTLSLLMIDIDYFKKINDRYGHVTGDEVLKWFADLLQDRLRQDDVPARWGGEEFTILANGTQLDRAYLLAEQIRQVVATCQFGSLPCITVSIGVAEYQRGESSDALLVRADNALYKAKRNGRNQVMVATSEDGAEGSSGFLFEAGYEPDGPDQQTPEKPSALSARV